MGLAPTSAHSHNRLHHTSAGMDPYTMNSANPALSQNLTSHSFGNHTPFVASNNIGGMTSAPSGFGVGLGINPQQRPTGNHNDPYSRSFSYGI